MPYHELLLVPSVGHFGKGNYDPGHSYGYYFEIDILKELVRNLDEILDNHRIRVNTLKLWDAPGIASDEIHAHASTSTLTLVIGLGGEPPNGGNATKTVYSHPPALRFAELVSEAAADWAKCCNFHHLLLKPRLDAEIFPHHAVKLEPFSLFTADPGAYLKRMPVLAQTLAGCIMDYMGKGQHALRGSPYSAWKNEKQKNEPKPVVESVSVGDFLRRIESGVSEAYLPENGEHQTETAEKKTRRDDTKQKHDTKQRNSQAQSRSSDLRAVPDKERH